MLLGPASASAVALDQFTYFILGQSPYLKNSVDSTPVIPGTVAPANAPDVDQIFLAPNWIKLDAGDVTIGDGTGDSGFQGWSFNPPTMDQMTNADTVPVPISYGPSISWNGTIHGLDYADGSFGDEYCGDFPETEGQCLMMMGERVKLMAVIWDVRWTPDPLTSIEDFVNSPSLNGGFHKDSFGADVTSDSPLLDGPIHVDDEISGGFLSTTPLADTEIAGGVGVKFALLPGQEFVLESEWTLAENPLDRGLGGFADNDMIAAVSVFAYYVPEPGMGLLLVSGLIGLAAFGRRRRA
jgi:hypothetical protein